MTTPMYKPFGSMTSGSVDFSTDSGFVFNGGMSQIQTDNSKKDNSPENVKEIFKSAVGDFAERPLQIMIREIAKNILIFTPIGWIILMYIVCRKYKGKLSDVFANAKVAFADVIDSLGLQQHNPQRTSEE